jgi:hypothetical protein
MLQNIILTISVGMRNYHYVEYYALAYKRLGVFIFLALVVVGLITMVVKINQKRTGYYLIRVNALTVYLVMVVISCANWDNWIIAYNLKAQHKAGFDVAFCHELSDKTIPYVLQNLDVIEREITKEAPIEEVIEYDYFRGQDDREKDLFSQFKSTLLWRAERFVRNYESNSWASWNYQDHMAYEKLKNYFKNEAANSNIDQRSFSMIK